MERPDIIGWEITTNENGIKMATLPQSKMNEILEYIKNTESELKKLRVTDVSGMLKSFVSYAESRSISDININDDTIEYFIEDFNLH